MAKNWSTPSNLKSVRLEITGLEEYLQHVQAAGQNIEEAVSKAVAAGALPIYGDIQEWAERHKLTGTMLEGVDMSAVQRDGNRFFVEVGINEEKSKGSWHAVFVEYGTPTQPADPGIRTAFARNKSLVKKIQRGVLVKAGVPVD